MTDKIHDKVNRFITLATKNYENGGRLDDKLEEYEYYDLKHFLTEAIRKSEEYDKLVERIDLLYYKVVGKNNKPVFLSTKTLGKNTFWHKINPKTTSKGSI